MSKSIKNTDFQIEINNYIKNHSNCIGFAFFEENIQYSGDYRYVSYYPVKVGYGKYWNSADIVNCCMKNVSVYRSHIFSSFDRNHPDYMAAFSRFMSSMDKIKIFYVMVGSQNIEIDKEKFIESIHLNAISMLSYSGKEK